MLQEPSSDFVQFAHDMIDTGVDILRSMSIGVKGGNNDNVVEKLLNGSWITGIMINNGSMTGSIAGNCNA